MPNRQSCAPHAGSAPDRLSRSNQGNAIIINAVSRFFSPARVGGWVERVIFIASVILVILIR